MHERRCKADDNDELLLESQGSVRQRLEVASRSGSKDQELRSRISGKETADSKKQREALGPGDDQMLKMQQFNSYRQLKFSGVGIGGKPMPNYNRRPEMSQIQETNKIIMSYATDIISDLNLGSTLKVGQMSGQGHDDVTRRDSIFPSELDGEGEN